MSSDVALYYHSRCLDHVNGPGHPERPERLEALHSMLVDSFPGFPLNGGRDATRAELSRVHAEGYLDSLESRGQSRAMLDPDTGFGPGSFDAALRGAGMTVEALLRLREGVATLPFVFPRPPGHHAETSRAMGFCLFNNVAVATRALQNCYDGERVAILDYDVHHGNGTQWSFYDDPTVLYISLHQSPLFPGTGRVTEVGEGPGEGFTVNLPMSGGKGDDDYIGAADTLILPILREFAPDTLLVSAGFDAHASDPLAGMALTEAGYRTVTERLVDFAGTQCGGRLLHVLEGGYDLAALSSSVKAVLEVLEEDAPAREPRTTAFTELEEALAVQRRYWSAL